MKKKVLSLLILITVVFSLTGCGLKTNKDAVKFKKEYENLNGKENSSLKKHRTVSISDDNPYVYATAKDIINKIENKKTFYVYFGSAYCPWCRSVIEKSIEVAKKNNIKKIYYVDIWEGDHKEILRDTYELDENNKVKLISEGADEYQDLLKYLGNVLGEYTLTDENGDTISFGEKRIFAPNFIYVEKGKAKKIESGSSEKQTDSRMKLTDEMLKDEEKKFNEFFKN